MGEGRVRGYGGGDGTLKLGDEGSMAENERNSSGREGGEGELENPKDGEIGGMDRKLVILNTSG